MKLIEGKKARYLLDKEKIKNYNFSSKDYFLQQDEENRFVVNLYFIKNKNEIIKVISLSSDVANKADKKELEGYLKKAGLLKEKIIKDEDNDRL